MWLRKIAVLEAAAIACTALMSVVWVNANLLSSHEMAQLRGGNSN